MFRRAFTFFTAFSLVLCAVTLWLWGRGLHYGDAVWWNTDSTNGQRIRSISLRTDRGGFQVEDYRLTFRKFSASLDWLGKWRGFGARGRLPNSPIPRWTAERSEYWDQFLLSPFDWPDLRDPSIWDCPTPQLFTRSASDASYENEWRGAVIPYWLAAAASAASPTLWVIAVVRRKRRLRLRIRQGMCPRCGYDLRATPGRCPGCGTAT